MALYVGSGTPRGNTQANRAFSPEYYTQVNFGAKYNWKIISNIYLSSRFENSYFFAKSDIPILTPDNTFLITADDSNIYRFYFAATYQSVKRRISPVLGFGFGYNIENIGKVFRHRTESNDEPSISSYQYESQNYFTQTIDLGLLVKVYKQFSFEILYSSISNYKERKFDNINLSFLIFR